MKRDLAAMKTKRYGFAITLLVITALALVAPAAATDWPVTTATDIATTISNAGNGDTIILEPGTYTWHDLTIAEKSLTFRADASSGGDRTNTIIDAQSLGRIFSVTDASSLTIDNLTLQNGKRSGSGNERAGAINSGGSVTVTSSTFSGCSAISSSGNANGGAIYANSVTVTSSTFTGCSAGNGGAIYANSVTVTSSTFSRCSARDYGGAICASFGSSTVTSSTFTGCSASGNGGAIYASLGSVTVTSSTFTGCSASGNGGVIYVSDSSITVISSTFTGCSARDYGGAIFAGSGSITVTSSTFTGCSARYYGGAIYARGGTLHFCRIYDNDPGTVVYNDIGSLDAADNWWGTNRGPAGYTGGSGITSSPWLVLGVTASPSTTTTAQTSMVRANMTYNSEGTDTSARGRIPDDIPVTFSGSGSGTVFPPRGYTSSGISYTESTPTSAGTGYITATADGQSVTVPVTVGVAATTIVIDPVTPSTLYTGLDGQGIYNTTDGGTSWSPAITQPINKHIRALVIRPGDNTKLFAGTYGGGVYRSTDSGVTWTACPDTGLANPNVVSLVTDSSGKLYAGTEAGVFASTDNCATWAEMNGGLP